VVAPPIHPTHQGYGCAGIGSTQLAATVRALKRS
jgi:hypothetical protein